MGESADDSWPPGGGNEPAAELFSGAIAHVEELIKRLEYTPRIEQDDAATMDPLPRRTSRKAATKARTGPTEQATAPPDSQAEALRITLAAHDEANRLLGEAAQLRAQAAGDGQRILAEAQRVAEELRIEAEAEAERYLDEAAQAADEMRAQAEQAMRAAISDATAAADHVHSATQAEAIRVREEAATWAREERAAAEKDAAGTRASAEQDAEQIRERAAAAGRDAAERRVAAEVESAVAEAQARIAASQDAADRTLSGATEQVSVANERIAGLVEAAGAALAALQSVAAELDVLRGSGASVGPGSAPADTESPEATAHDDDGVADAAQPGESDDPVTAGPVNDAHPVADAETETDAADAGTEVQDSAAGDPAAEPKATPRTRAHATSRTGRPLGALFRGEKR